VAMGSNVAEFGAATLATRARRAIVPVAFLFVPKCPLCFLPFLAAFGSTLPLTPLLDGLVAATAAAWLVFLVRVSRSPVSRALAVLGPALLLAGRLLEVAPVSWAGAAVMLAVGLTARARKAARRSSGTGPGVPALGPPAGAGASCCRSEAKASLAG